MTLNDWQIDINKCILEANLRQVEMYASVNNLCGARTFAGLINPSNPGYFIGERIEVKAQPVKDSLEERANGRIRFLVQGDDCIDFDPSTGTVTLPPLRVVCVPRRHPFGREEIDKLTNIVNGDCILSIRGRYSAGLNDTPFGEGLIAALLIQSSHNNALRQTYIRARGVYKDRGMTAELKQCRSAQYKIE